MTFRLGSTGKPRLLDALKFQLETVGFYDNGNR